LKSSQIEIEYINFNIKQLLTDIQNTLREIAQKNNNKFTLDIDPAIPEMIRGDPDEIVANLYQPN